MIDRDPDPPDGFDMDRIFEEWERTLDLDKIARAIAMDSPVRDEWIDDFTRTVYQFLTTRPLEEVGEIGAEYDLNKTWTDYSEEITQP